MASSDHLGSLLRAALALNSALSLDDVLRVLSQFVPTDVGCERATLYLLDEQSDMLVSHVVWPAREQVSIRVAVGQGIAGSVAATSRALLIDDVQDDPCFDPTHDLRTGFRTLSTLAVPIVARDGRVLGVLQALNKSDGGSFSSTDQEYMTILATHAAVALQNARIFAALARSRSDSTDETDASVADPKANDPIGQDPAFSRALDLAHRVASTDASVLLRGESGTGKGLFARMIHRHSPRSRHSYVEINCAAIPRDLVETELFGVEKGVATGVDSRMGRLEAAHRGTCFLDEIGDMALDAQAKILKVLDDRKVERVGSRKSVPTDVRIVAATHQNLEQLIEQGRFRSDLFFRLDVVSIVVPPLRNRGDDVLLLAEHFARTKAARHRRKTPHLSTEVLDYLCAYAWPGNVRELENVIERGVVLSTGDVIRVGDLPPLLAQEEDRPGTTERSEDSDLDLRFALERTERMLLRRALEDSDGVQTVAARRLGISESNLRYRLKKLEA